MSDWLIVPVPKARLGELMRLLGELQHPPENVVVITTLPDPLEMDDLGGIASHLILWTEPGMTYGAWISAGLDFIARFDPEAGYALATGSDTRGNPGSMAALADGMRRLNLVMGSPDPCSIGEQVLGDPSNRSVVYRVAPEFICLDLSYGLRFDPEFRWWYDGDDLEMQARQLGNVGLIADTGLSQPGDGHYLNETQQRWAVEDRAKFNVKWGQEPW